MHTRPLLLSLICLAVAAISAPADLREEIEVRVVEWERAANEADVEAILALYAEDAVLYLPGSPPLMGHQALREYFTGQLEHFDTRLELDTLEIGGDGGLGYRLGTYELHAVDRESGLAVPVADRYLEIWRRDAGGTWRIHREVRPSTPPPPLTAVALDAYVASARDAWGAPGLAIAVVRGDEDVLVRGYGRQRVGEPHSVDEHTLFAIGSATKAFTAAAVAMLVNDGVLDWDDLVVDYLPGFVLKDPLLAGSLTIRDLLAHRSGLPMANPMWLSGLHDATGLIERLRHLEPVSDLRTAFTYQNLLYLAAGRVVEVVTGESWASFVSSRILAPLDMGETRTGQASLQSATNVATPHIVEGDEVRAVPGRDIDAVGPAGSLHSSAADMARWLRFQLEAGEVLTETHTPQMLIRGDGPWSTFYPETRSLAYGMGWVVSQYRGRTLLDHGGGIDGMTALVALVPEEGIGVAILMNLQAVAPPFWLLYPLLDMLLGAAPVDRMAEFRSIDRAVRTAVETFPELAKAAGPTAELSAYRGRFVNPALGEATITVHGGGLAFDFGRFSAPMTHWNHDTFRLDWTDRAWRAAAGPGWLTFRMNRAGEVAAFDFSAVPGESWTFVREDVPEMGFARVKASSGTWNRCRCESGAESAASEESTAVGRGSRFSIN